MRTRPPSRSTEPSTTPSTPSSRATSGSGRVLPRKRVAEVRETTRKGFNRASSAISDSVMPSANQSCSGSRDRFCSGSTAIARSRGAAAPGAGPTASVISARRTSVAEA